MVATTAVQNQTVKRLSLSKGPCVEGRERVTKIPREHILPKTKRGGKKQESRVKHILLGGLCTQDRAGGGRGSVKIYATHELEYKTVS